MFLLRRRRLIFWLIRAYFKKLKKTIFASFIFGLLVFFAVYFGWGIIVPGLPFNQHVVVGMVGSYTTDTLPSDILYKISQGLTYVSPDGTAKPDLASSWNIENNGKTYVFHLKHNVYFTDGEQLTASLVDYNFLDVSVTRPDKYTIVFKLKEGYAPFLVTVSEPIFKNGFVGVGQYKVVSVDINGSFVNSIELESVKDKNKTVTYQFYPTQEALKDAFVVGDVDVAFGLNDINFANTSFSSFINATVVKNVDYSHLVTIFYNTQDKMLSDRRVREALSYSVPNSFIYGKRNYDPLSPLSWAYQPQQITYQEDYAHAKLLLSQSANASGSAKINITLDTLPQYEQIAQIIADSWKNINVNTKIVVVDSLPPSYQAFLGDFNLPQDPDQYTLWHSGQQNNITNYKNLRIDKLLEDARQTVNMQTRINDYQDFQKYLLDDAPATFLYLPYSYTVTRKSVANIQL